MSVPNHLPEELRLAILHEREECARVADAVGKARRLADDPHGAATARQVAEFIRERSRAVRAAFTV